MSSGSRPVSEEFRVVDAPSPFNGIGAVLNARYVFNAWEKLLFAKGTFPVLLRDHAYAAKQDDISFAPVAPRVTCSGCRAGVSR